MDYGLKPLGREKLWLWLMLVPTIIGLAFGTIGSLLATLGLSFFDWDLINLPKWVGTENYAALFQNEKYVEAFVNTLKFSALYVPGVVIISLLLAVLLNRKIRGVGVFPHHLFPAGCDLCGCHRPGLEHDLRQGNRHSEFWS